jgi:endoglucanase
MKPLLFVFAILLFLQIAYSADDAIRINSLGFLPAYEKKATITAECSEFVVKTEDGQIVFSGKPTGPVHQNDVNQDVWIADFSALKTAGEFYLDVPGVGRSITFPINERVYDFAYVTAMRAMYLWRCGTAVETEFNGIKFSQGKCHVDDALEDYLGRPGQKRDGTGGWHDAGDYGKYVVNASVTVGCLFLAWDQYKDQLSRCDLKLPETARGYPDFLKEIKWETDWLLKMTDPNGSGQVSHKLTSLGFCGFVMPEADTDPRYFTEWSTAATADFVAMMAMAARYFKPYDAAYAKTCLDAATKSYECLQKNPEEKRFQQGQFRTGGYQTDDGDDRLWAAAELWETTGNLACLADFEKRVQEYTPRRGRGEAEPSALCKVDANWDWGNVRNLGVFTFLLSKREGKNPQFADLLKTDLLAVADSIVVVANKDVYGRPLGGVYFWGCNGLIARQVLNLQIANKLSPNPKYVNAALDAIAHIFGRNYYGRSYVTGLGVNPPMNPHDRRSGADGIVEPWPGYIVGGGHTAIGWHDSQDDYATNEIAINWQAALIYALAGFVNP